MMGADNLQALVVDDYPQMRAHLVEILTGIGVSCASAECGTDALQMLHERPFDILFTDLVMPEMDGFELCEEVRRRSALASMPVVVTSTHRDAGYVIQALQRGADDYISKPASPVFVRRVLRRVMTHV